jgi:hypothetical protein
MMGTLFQRCLTLAADGRVTGYLLELVRYIHLNPLRANQVPTLKQLYRYRYSGHSALMGLEARYLIQLLLPIILN